MARWEGKFGPAFVGVIIQTIVVAVGGLVFVTRTGDTADSSKQAVVELKSIVSTLQASQSASAERLGRVETSLVFIANGLQRIENRLDNASGPRRGGEAPAREATAGGSP